MCRYLCQLGEGALSPCGRELERGKNKVICSKLSQNYALGESVNRLYIGCDLRSQRKNAP